MLDNHMTFPTTRLRRLRYHPAVRELVRETQALAGQSDSAPVRAAWQGPARADCRHARPMPIVARHAGRRSQPGGGTGAGRGDSLRHPGQEGRPGQRRHERLGHHRPGHPCGQAGGQGFSDRHRRLLLRIHRSRPLRGDRPLDRPARRGERRHARSVGPAGGGPRPGRGRHGGPQRHDRRHGRRDSQGVGRGRLRARADHELRGEVRQRVLRPVPRGGRERPAVRRPPRLPDGSRRRPRARRCGKSNSIWPKGPTS